MAQGTIKQVTNNSNNSYCKMPDGTLLQWGTTGAYDNVQEKTYTVTLPIAYVDWSYKIIASGGWNASTSDIGDTVNYDMTVIANVTKKDEFKAHLRNPTRPYVREFHWLTIGRWK